MKKYITISFFLLSANLFGQQFYYFTGLEGVNYTNDQISSLETLAASIVDIIPDTSITNHFKVISVGAYPLSYSMNFNKEEVFGMICEKYNACNDNYILITKNVIDNKGNCNIYAKIHFNNRISQCFDEDDINRKFRSESNYGISENSSNIEQELIQRVYKTLDHVYNCCDNANRNGCSLFEEEGAESVVAPPLADKQGQTFNTITNNFISPTGCIFQIDEVIRDPKFGYYSTNQNFPHGALMSFRRNDTLYHAQTDVLTKTIFHGYKSDSGKYAKTSQIFQNGQTAQVKVASGYRDCSTNLYTFNYTQNNCPMDSVEEGGKGYSKLSSLGIDFTPKTLIEYNNMEVFPMGQLVSYYIGDYPNYETIYYSEETGHPCPDTFIYYAHIVNGTLADMTFVQDREDRMYVYTPNGTYCMYKVENKWLFYVFMPGHDWLLFTPKNWGGPNQLVLEIFSEIRRIISNPHTGLVTLSILNVPVFSQLADIIDGSLYLVEGNLGEATLSFAGVIPGVTEIYKGGNWTLDVASGLAKQYKWNKAAKIFEKTNISKVNELQDYIAGFRMPKERVLKLKQFFKEKGYVNDFLEKKSLVDAFDALNKSTDPKILQYADDFDTLKKLADDIDAHPELKALLNNGNPDDVIHAWKMMTENVPPIQLCFF